MEFCTGRPKNAGGGGCAAAVDDVDAVVIPLSSRRRVNMVYVLVWSCVSLPQPNDYIRNEFVPSGCTLCYGLSQRFFLEIVVQSLKPYKRVEFSFCRITLMTNAFYKLT